MTAALPLAESLDIKLGREIHQPMPLDDAGRERAARNIKEFAITHKLSGLEKDGLLARLAGRLDLDYQDLCQKRIMHLISPEEARALAARGVDLQYHTHRHRVYSSRDRMFAELQDNRSRIASYTSSEPRHFCYTGGFYLPQHPGIRENLRLVRARRAAGASP